MIVYLLDTNAFSDLMRRQPEIEAQLAARRAPDSVVLCAIVRGEILYGMVRMPAGKKRRELEERSAELFPLFPCEPVPAAAGDHYARLKFERQRLGLSLDENDLWVAATALALGATLVTRDGHFQGIGGLDVEDWTQPLP